MYNLAKNTGLTFNIVTFKVNFPGFGKILSVSWIQLVYIFWIFLMTNAFVLNCRRALIIPATVVAVTMSGARVKAQNIYNPIELRGRYEISDTLSEQDIPTGQGGFARDYKVTLSDIDQVAIDLISDDFDAIISLIAPDGTTIAENDDGPDGTTNSLLFARIQTTGDYIVRVRAFGEGGIGSFDLKVTRLRPIDN